MNLPRRQSVVYLTAPGQVELRQVPLSAPESGEVVVRVEAATTCGTDVKVFRRGGHPRMLRPPCPFGHEVAGRIVAIGAEVTGWDRGEEVVVANSACCGGCLPCRRKRENLCQDLRYLNGAFAQFLVVPERFVRNSLYRRPPGLEAAVAALAEPLACVVHGVERMRIENAKTHRDGEALVLGGGPIGLMFTYLLAADGWAVTVEDRHPSRLDLALALGAERARAPGEAGAKGGAEGFDATVDATGTPEGWKRAAATARAGAVVNLFGGCAPGTRFEVDATRLHYDEISLLGSYHHRPANFQRALEILARDDCPLDRLISRTASLSQVGAALEEMSQRRALKVAIVPPAEGLDGGQ